MGWTRSTARARDFSETGLR